MKRTGFRRKSPAEVAALRREASSRAAARRRARPTKVKRDGRLVLSEAEWLAMKKAIWNGRPRAGLLCGICTGVIECYEHLEPDHKIPRGFGGGTRDDRPENIQPSHRWCNREKGSQRI